MFNLLKIMEVLLMDSFIAWIGGKKLLRKEIVQRFPEKFDKYVEVFGGAAWVLFYKEKYAPIEVYNDINSELVNLFKCVKYHPNAFEEEFQFVLNGRGIFKEYSQQLETEGLTDIQRASRYLYLIRASYGARIISFGGKNRDVTDVRKLKEVRNRLSKVLIENRNFAELIKAHDSKNTLFYLDPPYHKAEKYYNSNKFVFDKNAHIELRNILSDIKGKFVLSYNDDAFVRELYKNFKIEEVQRANNLALAKNKNKIYKELIITNY